MTLSPFFRRVVVTIAWATLLLLLTGIFIPTIPARVALIVSLASGALLQAAVASSAVHLMWHRYGAVGAPVAIVFLIASSAIGFAVEYRQTAQTPPNFRQSSNWINANYDRYECSNNQKQIDHTTKDSVEKLETLLAAVQNLEERSQRSQTDPDASRSLEKAYLTIGDLTMADCQLEQAQAYYELAAHSGDEFGIVAWKLAYLQMTIGSLNESTAAKTNEALAAAREYYARAAQKGLRNPDFLNEAVEAEVIFARRQLSIMPAFRQWVNSAYESLTGSNPDDITYYWQWATALYRLGYPEDAERVYRQVIALQPNRGDAWFLLAQLFEKTDRNTDAVAAYRNAITRNPRQRPPYLALARLYAEQGNLEMEAKTYAEAAARSPDSAWPHLELGKMTLRKAMVETNVGFTTALGAKDQ